MEALALPVDDSKSNDKLEPSRTPNAECADAKGAATAVVFTANAAAVAVAGRREAMETDVPTLLTNRRAIMRCTVEASD
jgi:hypothetical protein